MIFPRNRLRPDLAGGNGRAATFAPRIGMAPSFLLFPVFGERKCQGEAGVKGDRSVESHAFLPLESLDEPCGAGGEELFQMLVRQFLVQEPAVHGQSTTFIVAAGNLLPDDDMPSLAFGTGERTSRGCRKAEVQDFAGGLARVVRDGSHESLGRERVPLDLQQGLFPASRQGDIRHKHLLHRLVDMQPLFRGDDALARSGDVVALEQGGNDGGSRGGRSFTASRACSSAISLPQVSMAASSVASV